MANSLLQVKNLHKIYTMGEVKVSALSDVSFNINEGEFVVILGASGSGKSTLLNIIGGMDTPTSGEVIFNDNVITSYDEKQLTYYRRNNVGFIFQFYNLMATLTAKENVELATEICKDSLNIDQILDDVGLTERKDHFPSQLSGGEQQRVAIARAAAKKPDIMLCDEPTGALDFETGIAILKVLKNINVKFGKTVIIITHNSPIAQMADKVITMRSGKIRSIKENENPISPERIEW